MAKNTQDSNMLTLLVDHQAEMFFSGKTIVVSGAAGFIGSHLVRRLAAYGAKVIALDKITGEQRAGVHWIITDLLDVKQEHLKEFKIDIVYHLAAVLGVAYAGKNPHQAMAVNVLGTSHFLKLVKALGAKVLCITSSSEVYGEPKTLPMTEESPLQPLSWYGWSKVCAEKILEASVESGNICGIVIRPFNVYGPGQRSDFVISRFMHFAMHNTRLEIVGTGQQQRVFTFIDDFINGLLLAVLKNRHGFHVYNLAGEEATSITTLAHAILSITHAKTQPVYLSEEELERDPHTEITMRIPSIEKAQQELAYQPQVSLQQGLERIYTQLLSPLIPIECGDQHFDPDMTAQGSP